MSPNAAKVLSVVVLELIILDPLSHVCNAGDAWDGQALYVSRPVIAVSRIRLTSLRIVQAPMLGYWLVFPVVCVMLERTYRLYLTFFGHHPARLEALDDGTVVITAEKPEGHKWRARAGQYVRFGQYVPHNDINVIFC